MFTPDGKPIWEVLEEPRFNLIIYDMIRALREQMLLLEIEESTIISMHQEVRMAKANDLHVVCEYNDELGLRLRVNPKANMGF